MHTPTRFTDDAWQRNLPLFEATLALPFNQALADGTLARAQFQHYMIQDAHYLVAFGRALAVAAAKADAPDDTVQLVRAAEGAIVVERDLHDGFLRSFDVTPAQFEATPLSPACHHYVHFLLSTALRAPYPVVLGALLPCFWIYAEVGRAIHARATRPGNPYQPWIDTYAGDDFHRLVAQIRATVDRAAARADAGTVQAMHAAYTDAARLEWMFWDSAYRQSAWPV